MTRAGMLLLCAALLLLPFVSFSQDKYSKVRIPTPNSAVRQFMIDNLELDHYESKENEIIVFLDNEEVAFLQASGYKHEILIDDVVAYTTEYNKRIGSEVAAEGSAARAQFQYTCGTAANIIRTPTLFGTGGTLRLGATSGFGYFKYTEMVTKMQALVAAYPALVSLQTIGTSQNGTTIYGVKISDNVANDEAEPEVLYTALQHAREAIGGTSMIFFMQYLIENYAADPKVKALVDNREIYIVPCVNVDGYAYNYSGVSSAYPVTGGGLWRKNRRLISGSGSSAIYGVDINRNYSVDWGNCAGASTNCGTNDATKDTYYGPSAFSEKETQSIRNFVYSHRFSVAIDQHCFGPYYSLPFGRPSLHTMGALDQKFYEYIPALMGTYNCHRAGNSPETVNYEVAGGIKDWLLLGDIASKGKVYGMTGEAGGDAFWAPISQIESLCKGLCYQNLQMAYAAGSYFNIEDGNDISITATSGKFGFKLRNIGLAVNPVTVSIEAMEGLKTIGSSLTTTLSNYNDTYTDSISYTLINNVQSGQRIRFRWKWESGGIISYDTVVKIYNPLTLLSDDMEGSLSTNWTTTSNSTVTSTKWQFTNTAAYGGSKSLTESASGNYTSGSTRTVTYNGTFNLTNATNAYLSFWVKHRAENCSDKLQVQFSTNGTNYTAICGSHTISENDGALAGQPALTGIRDNWTREIFDLSAYKGEPAVYMRFQFTSDAEVTNGFEYQMDDGFYIDNVKVVKTSMTPVVLGATFLQFSGKLLPDNAVRLNWEAVTDEAHDHFEIERSFNGRDFVNLGHSNRQPPYKFLDANPAMSANYYRIRQVDKDGKVTHSNVILIELKHRLEVSIYPNPVRDMLSITITATKPDQLRLEISDSNGRTIHQRVKGLDAATNSVKIPVGRWGAGVYVLKLYAADGTLVSTQKVVKI